MFKYVLSSFLVLSSSFVHAMGAGVTEDSVGYAGTARASAVADSSTAPRAGYMQLTPSDSSHRLFSGIVEGVLNKALDDKVLGPICRKHFNFEAANSSVGAQPNGFEQQIQFIPNKTLGQEFHATIESVPHYSSPFAKLEKCLKMLSELEKEEKRIEQVIHDRVNAFAKLTNDHESLNYKKAQGLILFRKCDEMFDLQIRGKADDDKLLTGIRTISKQLPSEASRLSLEQICLREILDRAISVYDQVSKNLKKVEGLLRVWHESPPDMRINMGSQFYSGFESKEALEDEMHKRLSDSSLHEELGMYLNAVYKVQSVDQFGQFIAVALSPVGEEKENLPLLHVSVMKVFSQTPENSVLDPKAQAKLLKIAREEVESRAGKRTKITFGRIRAKIPSSNGNVMKDVSLEDDAHSA